MLANLPGRLQRWAREIEGAALCYSIDPHLLAAIVDRESRGGDALKPPGPAGTGDVGHGHGLGQLDDRTHALFIGARLSTGKPCWSEAAFNLLYAAWLLRQNLDTFTGETAPAVAAYNCGTTRVRKTLMALPPDAPRLMALDRITTGGDYVSDVFVRRARFAVEEKP